MTPDELRDVIVKPATATGLLVERQLTARIVKEVADQPGALPMLSHALLETWRRRRGRTLTTAAYAAVGGVHGAIATTAEQVYAQLSRAQARTARQVLLRLIEPGQGGQDTHRPISRTELEEWADPTVPVAVEQLARARLLTVDRDGVQLAHEALITRWPRLQDWIEEDRERLRHHRRLTESAAAWREMGRDPSALYRGTRLARAEELFLHGDDDHGLTTLEQGFLAAALEAREAEHRAAAATTLRNRALVGTMSALLVLAAVAGLVAWQQNRATDRERTQTAARRVASVADAMRTTDPRTAMLLSVAAWRIAPLPEARRALLGAAAQPEQATFTDPGTGENHRRFLADSGRTLLTVDGRTWRTWNVATHRRIASGHLPDGTVNAAAPDGRVLALSLSNGQSRLWDTSTGKWASPARPLPSYGIEFGADAHNYLASDEAYGVQVRSVTDNRLLLQATTDSTAYVAPSADGRFIAVCPHGEAPTVWDTVHHRALPGAWQHIHGTCDDEQSLLAFGGGKGGSDRLAAVTDSGSGVRVWDTASGKQLADIDFTGAVYLTFSPDGSFLAASGDDEIRVWRLSSPDAPVFRHALNGQRLYGGLAWDPGRPVLRYLEGGTVHSLSLTAAVTTQWLDHPVDGEALSPDGRTLATVERTGRSYRFVLRSTIDGHLIGTLPSPPLLTARDDYGPIVPGYTLAVMAFSPDSGAFAYGVSAPGRQAAPERFVIWDLARHRERTTLDLATSSSGTAVTAIALGPGGHTLLALRTPTSGSSEEIGEVWDTSGHRRSHMLDSFGFGPLATSPDGLLAADAGGVLRMASGPMTLRNLGQGEQISALGFSPDGTRAAAGDVSGRVALWDGTLRHRTGILRSVFPTPAGDEPEAVSALAYSPDGRTLAVAGNSGTLQLWDTATQQPLGGLLTTPGEQIDTLAFSPDSGTLYAGSGHVPLQRYPVTSSYAIAQACARAGTSLTPAQWHEYIPDAPYRRVCGLDRPR